MACRHSAHAPARRGRDAESPVGRRMRRVAMSGTAAVVAMALIGCGGGPRAVTASAQSRAVRPAQDAQGAAAASGPDGPAEGTTTSSGSGAAGSMAGSNESPGPAPFATAFAVSARFGSACVRPGERQTITITTLPEAVVAYHAQYSDGKDALDPGYYGGNSGGTTDARGVWTDSWVVSPAAPAGAVRVDVIGQSNDDRGYTLIFFDVADASGRCTS